MSDHDRQDVEDAYREHAAAGDSSANAMVEALQDRVAGLKGDRDKWQAIAITSAARTRLVTVVAALLLGVVSVLGIGGYVVSTSITSFQDALQCRATARVPYDDIRDQRDNLFAEGEVALASQNIPAATTVAKQLIPVLKKIRNGPTLPELYAKAGCND